MMFESILGQIATEFGMELENLCFSLSTRDFDFPFSFFEFEDEDVLGLLVTDEEGREKLHVIVKDQIVYFRIHYLDELQMLWDDGDSDFSKRVNIYE